MTTKHRFPGVPLTYDDGWPVPDPEPIMRPPELVVFETEPDHEVALLDHKGKPIRWRTRQVPIGYARPSRTGSPNSRGGASGDRPNL